MNTVRIGAYLSRRHEALQYEAVLIEGLPVFSNAGPDDPRQVYT